MKENDASSVKAVYILRYYLPVAPYADAELTELRFQQLLDFCRKTDTKAVMFYVAFHPDWYYMPDTVMHTEIWVEEMRPFVRRLRDAGISYQLNFQNLLGSIPGSADFRREYNWEVLTDHKGKVSRGCACPLGKEFRRKMGYQLRAWASTEPDVLWIDDDLRLHNHGAMLSGGYQDWFCYCDTHLRAFNREHGTAYTRESLLKDMLAPGNPSAVRVQWLHFQGRVMAETANWIRKEVQTVSPNTRLAQMTSLPGVHSAEGRDWKSFLHGLSGEKKKALLRPHFGPYAEGCPLDFLRSFCCVEQTRSHVMQQYGEADFCPEIENTRFTAWSKSVAATRFQLYLSVLLGCPGITLSLYDLEGSALNEEPEYEILLQEEKQNLDALAALELGNWEAMGAALVTAPDLAEKIELRKAAESPDALAGQNRTFDEMLIQCGIPVRYVSPEQAVSEPGLSVLDGDSICAFSDHQIEKLLEHNLLLDGSAALRLAERGYGEDIGILQAEQGTCMTSAEIFTAQTERKRMPCRLTAGQWVRLTAVASAEQTSTLVLCNGERVSGMIVHKNRRGGTVTIYPASGSVERGFYNHVRAAALREAVYRAAPTQPFFYTNRSVLTLARRKKEYLLLAAAPLSADGAACFRVRLPEKNVCKNVEIFGKRGFSTWKDWQLSENGKEIELHHPCSLYQWMIVCLKLEEKK